MKIFNSTAEARQAALHTKAGGRRHFLSRTVMGGLATVALAGSARAGGSTDAGTDSPQPCSGVRGSLADSVLIYGSLLTKVESAELIRLGETLNAATTEFQSAFRRINEKVTALKREVCVSAESQQRLDKLERMAAAASASTRLLGTLSGAELSAQIETIRLMCDKLVDTADCLRGGADLKGHAITLLDEIFKELGNAPAYACKADLARQEWTVGRNDLSNRLDEVRACLGVAIGAVLNYEKTPLTSNSLERARAAAVNSLKTPIEQLQKFPEYNDKKHVLPASIYGVKDKSAIELIVFLLEGLQKLIGGVPASKSAEQAGADGGMMIIQAAYRDVPALRIPSDAEIEHELNRFCPDPTDNKINNCRYACNGAWGQIGSKGTENIHIGAIKFSLNGGITGLLFDEKMTCKNPPTPDIDGLAVALANLMKG
jgi:hypothetical protein